MVKGLIQIAIVFILVLGTTVNVLAVPYRGFNYDYWGRSVPTPSAYEPLRSISARSISEELGSFNMPQDLFVDINGDIYLVDTGNSRIVVFDRDLNLLRIIDSFYNEGVQDSFNLPRGIFVTQNLDIYVADTENMRIVTLDADGNLLRMNHGAVLEDIEDDFPFFPLKISVDNAGRQFVIVRGVFEGIMRFDPRGRFTGYFGTIRVAVSPIDWFWRIVSTREQRARQVLFIPTEFTGMDIDEYGFIFTTNIGTGAGYQVQRLNPSGTDVLSNFTDFDIVGTHNYPVVGQFAGPSTFVDIVARGSGMYTAIDSNRGRLYTYDSEGNLLYVFGGTGNIVGMQRVPTALAMLDDTILVLDQLRGEITFYEPTEFGRLINSAIALRYIGDEAAAVEMWYRVLELDENYRLAHIGIGRSLLAAGYNREAMDYLRRGMDTDYYSVAFRRFRTEVLQSNINHILTAVLVLALIKPSFWIIKKSRKRWRRHADA